MNVNVNLSMSLYKQRYQVINAAQYFNNTRQNNGRNLFCQKSVKNEIQLESEMGSDSLGPDHNDKVTFISNCQHRNQTETETKIETRGRIIR